MQQRYTTASLKMLDGARRTKNDRKAGIADSDHDRRYHDNGDYANAFES